MERPLAFRIVVTIYQDNLRESTRSICRRMLCLCRRSKIKIVLLGLTTMLRMSFELIIAFLDVNQVLLLILKYHRHANNLKCFHWLSKSISFQTG